MRIYFSGGRGLTTTPEALIPQRKPHVMLTYHGMDQNCIIDRFNVYAKRVGFPLVPHEQPTRKEDVAKGPLYIESMFMDSGAFTFYNDHVMKPTGERAKAKAELLKDRKERWQGRRFLGAFFEGGGIKDFHCAPAKAVAELKQAQFLTGRASQVSRRLHDYSFYSLERGSEFREYCYRYAKLIRKYEPAGCLFTTVDAIRNPERTFDIQKMFEDEWGLVPVPVIHAGTSLKYLDRYLERRDYKLIGIGGLGQNMNVDQYCLWADRLFRHICPASNKHKPLVRAHGFAMTSWKLMCRWPWWSVDSATWVKLGAYGWVYVPELTKAGEWRFDRPPLQLGLSNKSAHRGTVKHVDGHKTGLYIVREWLKKCGIDEEDARNAWEIRSQAVLHYFKDFEESMPKWPHALDLDKYKTENAVSFDLKL